MRSRPVLDIAPVGAVVILPDQRVTVERADPLVAEASEAARLAVLKSYGILNTPPERDFDDLTKFAASLCRAPIALVSLVEEDRQWFKSKVGLEACSTPREVSFCTHALGMSGPLVVEDALSDPRFAMSPLVTGPPGIRAYAGVPLVSPQGYALGTLCVIDTVARQFTAAQLDQLSALARQVMGQLEFRRVAAQLAGEVVARRASEEALVESHAILAESERRWRALVEGSPVAVAVIGSDGQFKYGNPRATDLYGLDDDDALDGHAAIEFVPHGGEVAATALFASIFDGRVIRGHRWTLRRTDGVHVPVEINAAGIHYEGHAAVQVELRDMTAQTAAESALRESEARWRSLFEASPVAIGLVDEEGLFVAVNESLTEVLGRPEVELLGRSTSEFRHPDDVHLHRRAGDLIASSPDGVARIEVRFLRPDGEVRWGWMTLTHVPGSAGATFTLAHVLDVTDRKADEQALIDSEANLTAVAEVVKLIQAGSDPRHTIVEACRRLAGAAHVTLMEPREGTAALYATATTEPDFEETSVPLDATSATVAAYLSGEPKFLADAASDPRASPALLAISGASSLYIVPVRSGAVVVGVLTVGWNEPVAGLNDRRAGVVTLLAGQTGVALRQASLVSELAQMAHTDTLTGLPNRRNWEQLIALHMSLARRSDQALTVAVVDIDHFKAFNDHYGHPAGDELLRRFAVNGLGAVRAGDTFARWGGEEFALALPDCDATEAMQVLERVHRSVPNGKTVSIGYAVWDRTESSGDLVERADRAMYQAKATGRDRTMAA